MANDKQEFGETVWYQDPETKDVIYAIDGEDNRNFYSYAGVKDGVIAHPEHLCHYDLWFTEKYSLPEVKGFVTLRNASEESFNFKDAELKKKFDEWTDTIFAGRLSRDGSKLFVISERLNQQDLKVVCKYFMQNGLITSNSMIYWNGEERLAVKNIFEEESMHTASIRLSSATPVQNNGVSSYEDQETIELIERFKKGDKTASEELYVRYGKLVRSILNSHLKAIGKKAIHKDDVSDHPYSDKLQDAFLKFLERLKDYDPTNCKLGSFIYYNVRGAVTNALNPKRFHAGDGEITVPNSSDTEEDIGLSFDKIAQNREHGVEDIISEDFVSSILKKLDAQSSQIFRDYVFAGKTLDEIGDSHNLTKERIRQKLKLIYERLQLHPDVQSLGIRAEAVKLDLIFHEPRSVKAGKTLPNTGGEED